MAHNLEIKNGKASFFSVKEPAWHGLGTIVEKALTAQEVLEIAGLDYEVETQQLQTVYGIEVPNAFATVRTDTQQPLGVVSNIYYPIQNRDAFGFFDGIIDANEAMYETGGVLGQGERAWIMAKVPNHIRVAGYDEIVPYITLINSFNGDSGLLALLNYTRIVCWNTMSAAIGENKQKISIRHTRGAMLDLKDAHKIMGLSNKLSGELEQVLQLMSRTKITVKKTKEYLELLIPNELDIDLEKAAKNAEKGRVIGAEKQRNLILEAVEASPGAEMEHCKGTVYGLYNGVTHYLDHQKRYLNKSTKVNSLWLGDSADLRQTSFDMALTYVSTHWGVLTNGRWSKAQKSHCRNIVRVQ
jgi:phage/plasmid-like protein (TIGR03299 family)